MRIFIIAGLLLSAIVPVKRTKAQLYITAKDALADIDSMNQMIRRLHYNPFLFTDEKNYRYKTDSICSTIKDSVSFQSFILKLAYLTALLEDGHTNPVIMQTVLKPYFRGSVFVPLVMESDDTGVYVKEDLLKSGIPVGARLVSINGLDMYSFFKEACNYYGGLPSFRSVMATRLLNYYLFMYGIKPPFAVRYIYNGNEQTATLVNGTNMSAWLTKTLPGSSVAPYSFEIINDKLGYLDFVSMKNPEVFDRYIDSCIKLMNSKGIDSFVIDVRNNSGGNSQLADILISYFNTDKSYALWGGRYWRISNEYKQYLRENGDAGHDYLTKKTGTVWHSAGCDKRKPFSNDTRFSGRVFLLTGPFTFSSANMLADGIKTYQLATIIGEPTGENTNDFGETYRFTLPHSKVVMQVSTSYDIGADCQRHEHHPVNPDILIKTSLEDRFAGRDKVMEYLLKK